MRFDYFKDDFFIDLISTIPFDYIVDYLNISVIYGDYIRLTRLIKLRKIVGMLDVVKKEKILSGRLGSLVAVFFFLNHWLACIMYKIALAGWEDDEHHNMVTL